MDLYSQSINERNGSSEEQKDYDHRRHLVLPQSAHSSFHLRSHPTMSSDNVPRDLNSLVLSKPST
jgi:hypothetical protein